MVSNFGAGRGQPPWALSILADGGLSPDSRAVSSLRCSPWHVGCFHAVLIVSNAA